MYINVGAYVGDGTMVDSHALIGSCAQIGRSCHISAAAQIGGVLEPVGALPVVIEDEVLVGGNTGVYEGTIVKAKAVLGTGVILNRSTPIYDLVKGEVYSATDDQPLIVPENAVVVAGSRAVTVARARIGASPSTRPSSSSTAILRPTRRSASKTIFDSRQRQFRRACA
ncbi:MAG: DapH/DapD/GlmU-related protein [Paludibaculum sp.]